MKRLVSAALLAFASSTLVGCACTTCSSDKACCGDGTGACCTEGHEHGEDQAACCGEDPSQCCGSAEAHGHDHDHSHAAG